MKSQTITLSSCSPQMVSLAELIDPEMKQVILIVESGARVTCIDTRVVASIDCLVMITVHENAQLVYGDQRRFDKDARVKNSITLSVARDSSVLFEQWHTGGKKVYTTIDAQLVGTNAEVNFRLGSSLTRNQLHEVKTIQQHRAAHTKSRCIFKTIVAEKARSHYEGMINVETEAAQSEAFLDHRALLASEDAYAFARPSLQVYTDEVQCGHGSAIGQLDEEQLFYLQARGIAPTLAQEFLQQAFINELYSSEIMKNNFLHEQREKR